jgi:hypothetical protein
MLGPAIKNIQLLWSTLSSFLAMMMFPSVACRVIPLLTKLNSAENGREFTTVGNIFKVAICMDWDRCLGVSNGKQSPIFQGVLKRLSSQSTSLWQTHMFTNQQGVRTQNTWVFRNTYPQIQQQRFNYGGGAVDFPKLFLCTWSAGATTADPPEVTASAQNVRPFPDHTLPHTVKIRQC